MLFYVTVFILYPFSLLRNLNQTFINPCKLHFILLHNVYIAH